MKPTPVRDIVKALGFEAPVATMPNANKLVTRITWDSREVDDQSVFIAIPGERVDGNDFVVPAIGAGAQLVLATRQPDDATLAIAAEFEVAIIHINDVIATLSMLAGAYRDTLDCKVIGVTGSSGKTTTKDLIVSVLSEGLNTHGTEANRNNELGVPSTVLGADGDTEALVVEMGMRGRGQIERLCSFVKPQIGVITNIGVSHIELLGSQEGIAYAKGELLEALPEDGCAILCGDDPWTPFVVEHCLHGRDVEVLSYGFGGGCDVRGADLSLDAEGRPSYDICLPDGGRFHVDLPVAGRHNARNALAAAAAGYRLGLSAEQIAAGLETAVSTGMRFEVVRAACGATVINDAYNANPESMRAALETLAVFEAPGRRVAVLGDMGELGVDSVRFHREIGNRVVAAGVDLLVCVGVLARNIASQAIRAGLDADRCVLAEDAADALEKVRQLLRDDDTVLVKASHSVGLERVVEGLVS